MPIAPALTCPQCGHEIRPRYEPPTPRQVELLGYLERHIAEHGYAPSFEEIAAHFGFASLATVHEHLANMERKGLIRRAYNEVRAITVLVRVDDLGAGATV